ncbi:MAG: hypothetical protein Q8R23_06845 [Methylotenera sp.]|jgi:hypothetical protein|nr:hypothetical protein [Methylotenera sp.]
MATSLYYRTDEENEAADALLMAARFAEEVISDIRMWRWVIIALHNAVQGFMVLSLRHGNGLTALTEKSAAAWLAAYEADSTTYPDEKLDSYLCLYKKIKSTNYGTIGGNQNYVPQGSQDRSIRKLNRIRNDFSHFTPKGWSLELAGLPRICMDALAIVSFLGWETSNIHWHDEGAFKCAKSSCERLTETMCSLNNAYANQAG